MLTRMVAEPCTKDVWPVRLTQGLSIPPMPMPFAVPDTTMRWPSREPVMTIIDLSAARGTTTFDGTDAADQPAPVNAFTVKVYAVPFVRLATSHVSAGAVTRQVRPPGEEVTR